jgi:hypothetical protein
LEYLPGRFAFKILCYLGDTDLRWHRDKKVNMILRDVSTNDLYLVCVADLSNQITYPGTETARQNGLTVLGDPDQMIFAIIYCMRTLSV